MREGKTNKYLWKKLLKWFIFSIRWRFFRPFFSPSHFIFAYQWFVILLVALSCWFSFRATLHFFLFNTFIFRSYFLTFWLILSMGFGLIQKIYAVFFSADSNPKWDFRCLKQNPYKWIFIHFVQSTIWGCREKNILWPHIRIFHYDSLYTSNVEHITFYFIQLP